MDALFSNKIWWIILGVIVVFNLFVANHTTALWEEDETAYAGISSQMVKKGDWVNPGFVWSDVHRKPPMHFWSIAVSYKLFGINEFATRIPSAFAYLFLLLTIYFLGGKCFGRNTALLAILVLSSSFLVPNMAKIGFTDNGLLLWSTVAVFSLYLFLQSVEKKWLILFWIAVSLGVLIKGPPILILTMGIWGFLFVFAGAYRSSLIKMHPWFFLPLSLLPLFIWGYLSYQKDGGETVNFLIDWYIMKRFRGEGHVFGQTGPPGYHLAVFLLAFLPWMGYFPAALKSLYTKLKQPDFDTLFLIGWLLFGWFFYEIMSSKLPSYSIAAMPCAALLIAKQIIAVDADKTVHSNWVKVSSAVMFLITFFLMMTIVVAGYKFGQRDGMFRGVFIVVICWSICIVGVTSTYMSKMRISVLSCALFGLLTTTLVWTRLAPVIEAQRSTNKKLAIRLAKIAPSDMTVVLGEGVKQLPGIPFYLSQHFDTVYHEKMLEEAQRIYDTPGDRLYLMGDYWYERWNKEWSATNKSLGYSEKVEIWNMEKLEKSHYWLVMKNPPK